MPRKPPPAITRPPYKRRDDPMRRSRPLPFFLRKRRQLRNLPLWAVLLLIGWVAISSVFLDRMSPTPENTHPLAGAEVTAPPGRVKAHVVRVADGDTLTARTRDGRQLKVRLARIDAPETGHGAKRPGQPFGEASTRSLQQLAGNSMVSLDCPETDRYQRHVCWVYAQGVDVNLEQVKRGMAWVYRPSRTSRHQLRALSPLIDAQDAAQKAGRGIWIDAHPTAPWDWRRDCWQAGKCGWRRKP